MADNIAMPVITGAPNEPVTQLDSVFAFDSVKAAGVFDSSLDMQRAFDGVKAKLREACKGLGGDMVVHCQFEYRIAVDQGWAGARQVLELFAYGTAARRAQRAAD